MFVELVITTVTLIGCALYYNQEIRLIMQIIKSKFYLKVMGVSGKQLDNYRNNRKDANKNHLNYAPQGFKEAIRRLIAVTTGIDSTRMVYYFYAMSLFPAFLFSLISWRYLPRVILIIISVGIALIPLVIIMAKLQNLRIKSSKEGKILLIELLDNYKINYYNMQQAIEVTISTLSEAPSSKRLLFNLSKGLNRVSSNEEIKKLLEDFKYSIGTSWAGILADNIYFALSSGIRVEMAMEDLIKTISMAEEVEERAKRENSEAGLILKYMVPACYLLTFLGATRFFGLSPLEFFHYQFETPTGIGWFVAIVTMYVVSLICQFFLTKSKLDI